MDEFVLIQFVDDRMVFVDDTPSGSTNTVITVQRGTHDFDLGEPKNYKPGSRQRAVFGTTKDKPMVLKFTKV